MDKATIEKKVRELAEDKLKERTDLFIVSIKSNAQNHITLLLDGDNGIGIHDCALISRHIAHHLEEENFIDTAYTLDVSSPGIETPLILDRQYHKNIGRNLEIKLTDNQIINGKLTAVFEEKLQLSITIKEKDKKGKEENIEIAKADIVKSVVKISFK